MSRDKSYIEAVTVLEAIRKSTEFLAKKGVEAPRLQTELLLAHLLSMPRMKLYLNFERTFTPAETKALRELIKRRGMREPLQHIVGSSSFCGMDIAVNRHALVPRPETEQLAERGWEFLNKLSVSSRQPSASTQTAALDFGTGTGCIAVALAVKCPGAQIYATDISQEALDLAGQNAARHDAAGRIQFLRGDGFAALPGNILFDLIISNPPYIPSAEIQTLQPEVRDHDPRRALDGGPDGLDFFRKLAAGSRRFLKSDGRIMLEFGDGQATSVQKIFREQNWIVEAMQKDYSQRPRILIASNGDGAL